jgi:hypothetical protein
MSSEGALRRGPPVTNDELVERLVALGDDPDVAAYVRVKAFEVVGRLLRDEKRAVDPVQRKRDELAARRLANR